MGWEDCATGALVDCNDCEGVAGDERGSMASFSPELPPWPCLVVFGLDLSLLLFGHCFHFLTDALLP